MAVPPYEPQSASPEPATAVASPDLRLNLPVHILLFALTFVSVAYTCAEFVVTEQVAARMMSLTSAWDYFLVAVSVGTPYAVLLMGFLTAHEFGHYIAARRHGVAATLPYYIPMPFVLFGTLGAVIRTRSPIMSRRALFDIGVAGPLAGFVVALAYLVIGVVTLPGVESIYAFHPWYRELAAIPNYGVHFGSFLLLDGLQALLAAPGAFFPPTNEIYHYPFLGVGWFAMFVTSLNLLPVGQLDGGHIVYAMFGRHQRQISRWFMRFLVLVGAGWIGTMLLDATRTASPDELYQFLQGVFGPIMEWIDRNAAWWFTGWPGWLLWWFILRILIRVEHPPVPDGEPLNPLRMALGWLSLAILIGTFSYTGISYVEGAPEQTPTSPPVEQPTLGPTVRHQDHDEIIPSPVRGLPTEDEKAKG